MEEFDIAFGSETDTEADNADQLGDRGEEEQDVAAPAQINRSDTGVKTEVAAQEIGSEDAMAARIRRTTEQRLKPQYEERIRQLEAQAKKAAQADALAKSKGFESFEDMNAALAREAIRNGEIPGNLEAYIASIAENAVVNHPAVLQAQRMTEQAEVDCAVNDLKEQFPELGVGSIEEFPDKIPNYPAFFDLVTNRGMTYVEAHVVANRETIVNAKAKAAAQAAFNNVAGKSHLRNTVAGNNANTNEIVVPRDTYRSYRSMMPEWTDKQIREHYQKSLQSEGVS